MTISASIVLYAVIWFMTLFVVLPLRLKSQQDSGEVVPGTPASAPSDPQMKKRAKITTLIATLIWVAVCAAIITGLLSMKNLGFEGRY